jgi:hypothetical protein
LLPNAGVAAVGVFEVVAGVGCVAAAVAGGGSGGVWMETFFPRCCGSVRVGQRFRSEVGGVRTRQLGYRSNHCNGAGWKRKRKNGGVGRETGKTWTVVSGQN